MMGYDLQVLKALEQGLPVITVATSFQDDRQGMMTHDNVGSLADKTILVATSGRTTTSLEGWKSYIADPTPGNALIKADNPKMTDELAFGLDELRRLKVLDGGDAQTMGIGIIIACPLCSRIRH